jgi:hypothetical protein
MRIHDRELRDRATRRNSDGAPDRRVLHRRRRSYCAMSRRLLVYQRRTKGWMQRTASKQSGAAVHSEIPVEVVGLQSQLTVPSRHHPQRVDLWIEVNWPQRTERWDEEFHTATAAVIGDSVPVRSLSLQTLSRYRGWIVARGVPRDRDAHRVVEASVRALVAQVNEKCATSRSVPVPPQENGRWVMRTFSMFGSVAAIFSSQAQ